MDNDFNATTMYCDVNTLIFQATQKEYGIDLNPPYQRDIVWNNEKQSAFINSVMRGIVPNPIILNSDNLTKICMDGKQRLTSLVRFKNNELPYIVNDSDPDDNEMIYYNNISHTEDENIRIMTEQEKSIFLGRNIPVVTYTNLTYDDQIDIFHRMQNGVAMKAGELITSLFTDPKISNHFDTFCDSKFGILKKFINNIKIKRHRIIIVNILYILENDTLKIPNKSQRSNFLRTKMNKYDTTVKLTKNLSELIDFAFGPKMLGHRNISNKIVQNIYYAVVYILEKYKKLNYHELVDNHDGAIKLRKSIVYFIRKYGSVKKITNSMEEINKKIIEINNNPTIDKTIEIKNKNEELSDESDMSDNDVELCKKNRHMFKVQQGRILSSKKAKTFTSNKSKKIVNTSDDSDNSSSESSDESELSDESDDQSKKITKKISRKNPKKSTVKILVKPVSYLTI
jgi:hypothetical protein